MSGRSSGHGWFVLRRDRRPSVSRILPNLLIGEYPEDTDVPWLRAAHGVSAVVNLQDHGDLASKGLRLTQLQAAYGRAGVVFHHIPIPDGDTEVLRLRMAELIRLLDALLGGGQCVYLHCNGGYNRAPTVAIAFLHQGRHMPLPDAIAFVKQRRACVPYQQLLQALYARQPS
jgi:protein-tyrosine phosphatase